MHAKRQKHRENEGRRCYWSSFMTSDQGPAAKVGGSRTPRDSRPNVYRVQSSEALLGLAVTSRPAAHGFRSGPLPLCSLQVSPHCSTMAPMPGSSPTGLWPWRRPLYSLFLELAHCFADFPLLFTLRGALITDRYGPVKSALPNPQPRTTNSLLSKALVQAPYRRRSSKALLRKSSDSFARIHLRPKPTPLVTRPRPENARTAGTPPPLAPALRLFSSSRLDVDDEAFP
ncbi:hypothetical protein P4O66_012645 [Electrophorus voltai]|uniref:Uncharacterized protein n=1 Tax=Electrophorus voltai TaxID=2609070 RepID=A0AAD9DRP5_9TELE|nr:hypothetical protein P4O66_012645 [Electrophorus voltai]